MATIITIPAGTAAAQCDGPDCGQTIYWAPNAWNGKAHPVSIDNAHGRAPTRDADGAGISHFSNCPNAARFRKAKRKPTQYEVK